MKKAAQRSVQENGQSQEAQGVARPMDVEGSMQYLAQHGHEKSGNDVIFSWFARYQQAAAAGADAINGTVGALLENSGELAINQVVDAALRVAPAVEFSAYAPLKGLPPFLDLAVSLALGDHRSTLEELGVFSGSTATPGGSGALYLAASNFAERGDAVLLRDRHWGPYGGFLKGCQLNTATYPLIPGTENPSHPLLDLASFREALETLANSQSTVMTWLNDPAHNPTGLSSHLRADSLCSTPSWKAQLATNTLATRCSSMLPTTSTPMSLTDGQKRWRKRWRQVCLGRKTC